MDRKVKKITRDLLRSMEVGDAVTHVCPNGYAQQSAMTLAYNMRRLEGSRFTCKTDGLTLTITRLS